MRKELELFLKLKIDRAALDEQIEIVDHVLSLEQYNQFLWYLTWEKAGPTSMPEFIKQQAKGTMCLKDGVVWKKRK